MANASQNARLGVMRPLCPGRKILVEQSKNSECALTIHEGRTNSAHLRERLVTTVIVQAGELPARIGVGNATMIEVLMGIAKLDRAK